MIKIIVLASAFALPGVADACQCVFPPLDTESVREAKNVFVFRLLSAELQTEGSDQPLTTTVAGRIDVVDTIQGSARANTIRYSTHMCCGTSLDVGKFYAAFTSATGPQLLGNSGNLIEVGEMYYPESGTRTKIQAVISGKERLEDMFSEYALDRTQQVPPPPAPYCPSEDRSGS